MITYFSAIIYTVTALKSNQRQNMRKHDITRFISQTPDKAGQQEQIILPTEHQRKENSPMAAIMARAVSGYRNVLTTMTNPSLS